MKVKWSVGSGIGKYISSLEKLNLATELQIRMAVYDGAGVIADEVKKRIDAMPTQDVPHADRVTGIKTIQKKGLQHGFGISRMKTEGDSTNVKLGFDGYNYLKSKKYPNGQPNAMIARTFESGNSFTKKIPFVAPAIRAKRSEAEKAMARVIDEEVQLIMS